MSTAPASDRLPTLQTHSRVAVAACVFDRARRVADDGLRLCGCGGRVAGHVYLDGWEVRGSVGEGLQVGWEERVSVVRAVMEAEAERGCEDEMFLKAVRAFCRGWGSCA
jgi:hypothetical protein